MADNDDYGREGASSQDIELIRRYGAEHDQQWVDVWGEREPLLVIVVLVHDDDLTPHERALRALVSRPDRLVVRHSPWPRRHLEMIQHGLMDVRRNELNGESPIQQMGIGRGIVNVRVGAQHEAFARQLKEQYGDAIDIIVGNFHFPDVGPSIYSPTRSRPRADVPTLGALPPTIVVSIADEMRVESGGSRSGDIRVTNLGEDELVLITNAGLTASVVDPTTGEVVGGWSGFQTAPLMRYRVPAGGAALVPILVGTTSSKPELGYCVPAGTWAFVVAVRFEEVGEFLTPPLPLEVVPRAAPRG